MNAETSSATAAAAYAGMNLPRRQHHPLLVALRLNSHLPQAPDDGRDGLAAEGLRNGLEGIGRRSYACWSARGARAWEGTWPRDAPLMTTRSCDSDRSGRSARSDCRAELMKTAPPIERPKTMPMNCAGGG